MFIPIGKSTVFSGLNRKIKGSDTDISDYIDALFVSMLSITSLC